LTLEISAAQEGLKESTDAVFAGNELEMAALAKKTKLLQTKYQLRSVENRISD